VNTHVRPLLLLLRAEAKGERTVSESNKITSRVVNKINPQRLYVKIVYLSTHAPTVPLFEEKGSASR
jgi:hypothetical protein